MSQKIAVLFSGQGAQSVGMGKALAEASPGAAALLKEADAVLGRSLTQIMFEGPEEELTKTGNCQPALFVHGMAALAALRERVGGLDIQAFAGLLLGEFTAHTAAGTFDFATGLRLVEQRGQFMEDACNATQGAMAAMIGGDEASVKELAAAHDVDVANFNCPGQIVLSGEAPKVQSAVDAAKGHGVRKAALLNVAGAYHSRLMQSAQVRLERVLADATLGVPAATVVANFTARPVSGAEEIRATLRDQVTGSVRWSESVEFLIDECGCNFFLELGPGGVLAGMMNRIRKGTPVFSVADPDGLASAVEALKS